MTVCVLVAVPALQTVMSAKALDPVAAALLHPEELAVYSASRKGRQVGQCELHGWT